MRIERDSFLHISLPVAKQASSHSEESELAFQKFQLVKAQSEALISECDEVISHLKPAERTL